MPRFLVTLCRKTCQYADIEVEAPSLDAAQATALEMAAFGGYGHWEPADVGEPLPEVLDAEELA